MLGFPFSLHKMAVIKPLRALGAASILLFFYLVYIIYRSPLGLHLPGKNFLEMIRDPNLERELSCFQARR